MSAEFTKERDDPCYSIPEAFTSMKAWKTKAIGYKTKRVFWKELGTANYVDSLIFDMRFLSNVLVHIKEIGGSQSISYQILACLDPSQWEIIKLPTILNAGQSAFETITQSWNWVKIQIAGSGQVNAFIGGKTK